MPAPTSPAPRVRAARALKAVFRREPSRAELPTLADIARYIPSPRNPEWPAYAHWDLCHLVELGLANVYRPASADFWNVWRSSRLAPPHGERITLEEWCRRWLAKAEADWEAMLSES